VGLNYCFSNYHEKRAKFIFNPLAPVCRRRDKSVETGFEKSMTKLKEIISFEEKTPK